MLVGMEGLWQAFFVVACGSGCLVDADGGWWVGEDMGADVGEMW